MRRLRQGKPFQALKEFLISIWIAGCRVLRQQYAREHDLGMDLGEPSLAPTYAELRAWAAAVGTADKTFKKASDFILRDVFSFVAFLAAGRAKRWPLRDAAFRQMTAL